MSSAPEVPTKEVPPAAVPELAGEAAAQPAAGAQKIDPWNVSGAVSGLLGQQERRICEEYRWGQY